MFCGDASLSQEVPDGDSAGGSGGVGVPPAWFGEWWEQDGVVARVVLVPGEGVVGWLRGMGCTRSGPTHWALPRAGDVPGRGWFAEGWVYAGVASGVAGGVGSGGCGDAAGGDRSFQVLQTGGGVGRVP